MKQVREVWIVAAARSPIGRFRGALSSLTAVEIASQVLASLVSSCEIDPSSVGECIIGNAIGAGLGQNPAKQVVLGAGLPDSVSAFCINKVCSSGMKAIGLGVDSIAMGREDVVIAGGMESMSNAPHVLTGIRGVAKLGDITLVDLMARIEGDALEGVDLTLADEMLRAGLVDAYSCSHMGAIAESVAIEFEVPREEQDAFAAASHRKAADAIADGSFASEIVPITLGDGSVVTRDEGVRAGTTIGGLSGLQTVFSSEGSITAGNASQLSDGAAAVVLMSPKHAMTLGLEPLASVVGYSSIGNEPDQYGIAPVAAVTKLLRNNDLRVADMDLVEINEAFCVSTLAVLRQLGIDPRRVNVNGGATALGHPIGASGARVLVTLLHAMKARGAKRGLATLCHGGGGADAVAVEALAPSSAAHR